MCANHGIGDGADQLGLSLFVDGQDEGAIGGNVDCLVVEAAVQRKGLDLVARRKYEDIIDYSGESPCHNLLLQVVYRDPVAHRANDRISIWCERQVPLAVHCSQQVLELQEGDKKLI